VKSQRTQRGRRPLRVEELETRLTPAPVVLQPDLRLTNLGTASHGPPAQMVFGPDGRLYLTLANFGNATAASVESFAYSPTGGLSDERTEVSTGGALGIGFGPVSLGVYGNPGVQTVTGMYLTDTSRTTSGNNVSNLRVLTQDQNGVWGGPSGGTDTIIVQNIPAGWHQTDQLLVKQNTDGTSTLYVGIGVRTKDGASDYPNPGNPRDMAYGGTISEILDLKQVNGLITDSAGFGLTGVANSNSAPDYSNAGPYTSTAVNKLIIQSSGTRNPFGLALDGSGNLWFTNNFNRSQSDGTFNGTIDPATGLLRGITTGDPAPGPDLKNNAYDQLFEAAPLGDYGYNNSNWRDDSAHGNPSVTSEAAVNAGFYNFAAHGVRSTTFDNLVPPQGGFAEYDESDINHIRGLGPSASADGIAFYTGNRFPATYQGNAFITRWNSSVSDSTGHSITYADLVAVDPSTGNVRLIANHFVNPLPVLQDASGNLLVADYGNAVLYRLSAKAVTWTGGGMNANWSNASNWSGGLAPNPTDNLVFGPGGAQLTTTNDYAAGTSFGTLTLSGAGYTLGGNGVLLSGGIDGSGATGSNSVNLNVTLSANATIKIGSGATAFAVMGTINNGGFGLTLGGGNGAGTLAGVISGSGGLTDASAGIVTLSAGAANTYTGSSTVQSGTLILADTGGVAIRGALTIDSGSSVRLGADHQIASPSAVTIGGALDLNGHANTLGALTLSGGTITTEAGTLTLAGDVSSSGTSGISGNLALGTSGRTFRVAVGTTLTVSASVRGGVGLMSDGPGTLVLSGANSYTGTTTQNAGVLAVGSDTAVGSGPLKLASGTVEATGSAVTLANAVTLGNITVAGTLGLTFTGPVLLTGNRTVTVSNTAATTLAGPISESGGSRKLIKTGPGTLVLAGANTYSGGTVLAAGALAVGNNSALGTGPLTWNGGTITASGAAVSLANPVTLGGHGTIGGTFDLIFTGAVTLTSTRLLTVSNTGTTTVSGAIGQAGGTRGLTKDGTGTLVLSGTDTYAGVTTVTAGTLLVNGSLGSAVSVAAGGTLGGSGSVSSISEAATGATVMPGTSATTGILSAGNLTLHAGGSFDVAMNSTGTGSGYDQVVATGTVKLNKAALHVSVGFTPSVGTTFTIIKNNGSGVILGTFEGLAEEASFVADGMTFQISYLGGSGHDVVLTRTA
jgi:autotransporter-associated beta strand protein